MALLVLMYLPWLRYYIFPPEPLPPGESYFEFPGAYIFIFFGLGYTLIACALTTTLYHRRKLSWAHAFAFYASLGIFALIFTLFW